MFIPIKMYCMFCQYDLMRLQLGFYTSVFVLKFILFSSAKVIRFSQLLALLPQGVDATAVLRSLQQVAVLVQGCWVVKRFVKKHNASRVLMVIIWQDEDISPQFVCSLWESFHVGYVSICCMSTHLSHFIPNFFLIRFEMYR